MSRVLKLTVAYDGTGFHGWQVQPAQRTVQGVLEEALSELLNERVEIAGAGRTDAGVHARGQCASFATSSGLPLRAFVPELRRRLPDDVSVTAAEEREPGFHARHSARGRRYAYRLLDRDDVLCRRHAWAPPHPAAAGPLDRATRALEGEHDFAAFASSGSPVSTTVCRVHRARWSRWERGLQLDIVADHFLYHMVRTIVGTALATARERDPAAAVRTILASRSRSAAGTTAPPQGLSLEEVFYPPSGETS